MSDDSDESGLSKADLLLSAANEAQTLNETLLKLWRLESNERIGLGERAAKEFRQAVEAKLVKR